MSDFIPYGRQSIDEDDVRAVAEVLRSDWLTTGPKVEEFESAFAEFVGAAHAVAVSNGTAALHAATFALGIGPGDEVVVPTMTFAATANCVLYQGGTLVFCDVHPDTLLIDPTDAERKITPGTKAVIAVDYAGQPCGYDALRGLASRHGLALVADASHSLGGAFRGRRVGSLADLSTFSFHPVKHMTTGEGGMVTTDDAALARKMRSFRNHGIETDHRRRSEQGTWFYEMTALGHNYRITDFQCALGLSQLGKVSGWVERRREIAGRYDRLLTNVEGVQPLKLAPGRRHAYHLYVVRIDPDLTPGRDAVFARMREAGIGVNVHYVPVHLHPYYRERIGTGPGQCPVAEAAYERVLSLPMLPAMADADVERVVGMLEQAIRT
ncbi:MAG: UDP-4-amino-4,6-dideoxy-N-acetyl-beta-L-altrosamine transaminase [Planctomycetota bacterium]